MEGQIERKGGPRRVVKGSANQGQRWTWSSPGPLSMQCLAYYREGGPGLYVACDDTRAQRKTFAVEADPQSRIRLELTHYARPRPGETDRAGLDYQVLLGTFQGDGV